MATVTKSNYSLRLFTSSSDQDFVKALALYAQYTAPELRTNTNEITYWLDHYNDTFKDQLMVLGFYSGKELIGFCEFAYFSTARLLAVDYLTIKQEYRKNNVFFEFIEHIKRFIADRHLEVLYIVTEVGKFSDKTPPDNSRALARLLKFVGFKVAKALYFQPQLGERNADSAMEAILMVYPYSEGDIGAGPQNRLAKATFLQIVETIYYDHYLRWYEPHLNRTDEYRKALDALFKKIDRSIGGAFIELNGHHHLLEEGEGQTVSVQHHDLTKTAAIGIAVIALTTICLVIASQFVDINWWAIAVFYLLVLFSFIAIIASLKESPLAVLKELTSIIKKSLRI